MDDAKSENCVDFTVVIIRNFVVDSIPSTALIFIAELYTILAAVKLAKYFWKQLTLI